MSEPKHPNHLPPAVKAALAGGLRYVLDKGPGITRIAHGKSFAYLTAEGKRVRDSEVLDRIRALAIPPAWTRVWICPNAGGHVQATGRDAKGRKQYRYHTDWSERRDAAKFEHMLDFCKALPRIRRRVASDLRSRGMGRAKVLATVVRLLETTRARVGNEEYARQNGSYGLTTLQNRHATVRGSRVTFAFKGKSGKEHKIDVGDPTLAKLVRKCQELPGQHLFNYVSDDGSVREVTSEDVNTYLREASGGDYSAKDFRTWAGTVLAAVALRECALFTSDREAKGNMVQAVQTVAQMLGNTPAVCRRSYIHPAVFETYVSGEIITIRQAGSSAVRLSAEERAVESLLRSRLPRAARRVPGRKPAQATKLR